MSDHFPIVNALCPSWEVANPLRRVNGNALMADRLDVVAHRSTLPVLDTLTAQSGNALQPSCSTFNALLSDEARRRPAR
jgi:hypothetical protein